MDQPSEPLSTGVAGPAGSSQQQVGSAAALWQSNPAALPRN